MQYVNSEHRRQDIFWESLVTEEYWIKSGDKKEIINKVVFRVFLLFCTIFTYLIDIATDWLCQKVELYFRFVWRFYREDDDGSIPIIWQQMTSSTLLSPRSYIKLLYFSKLIDLGFTPLFEKDFGF